MIENSKSRLSLKESLTEGKYFYYATDEEKVSYNNSTVDDKRKILNKFINDPDFRNELKLRKKQQSKLTNKSDEDKSNNQHSMHKTLNKHGLTDITNLTKESILKNETGKHLDSFMTRLSAQATGKNSDAIFTYELINQNFVLIKLLDEQLKDNQTLINQNEEIINLLKTIANNN